jgi:hypothetical protein
VVLCLSHDGACTDSFENFREISLKGDLSNDITLNLPLFSLVNTFNLVKAVQGGEDLLSMAQVGREDVMVVSHTLSQGKFIVLSLMCLRSSRQSRWGKTFLAWSRY